MLDSEIAEQNTAIRYGKRSLRQLGWTAVPIWAAILALMFVPAQAAEPPQSCGEGEDEPLLACESKMLIAQGELLDALDLLFIQVEESQVLSPKALTFASELTGDETDLRGHLGRMRREFELAQEELSETEESDLMDMIERAGKKRGNECVWREFEDVKENPDDYLPQGWDSPSDELGDVECNKFTAKNIESGKLKKFNERQLNICERVCDPDVTPDDSITTGWQVKEKPLKQDKLKDRHIKRKSESVQATVQLTEKIYEAKNQLSHLGMMAESYKLSKDLVKVVLSDSYLPDDPEPPGGPLEDCYERDKAVEKNAWIAKIVFEGVNIVAKAAAIIAEGCYEGLDQACKQVAFGTNASMGCMPALVIKLLADAVVEALDVAIAGCNLAIEHGTFWDNDANFQCMQEVRLAQMKMYEWVYAIKVKGEEMGGAVEGVGTAVGELDAAVQALTSYVLENREYIKNTREIVLTPHGQRNKIELYEAPLESPPS